MEKIKHLPLNGLEKFMLAHESDVISYNSQIAVEFEGTIDTLAFKEVIKKAVSEIPWLRTVITESIFRFNRHVTGVANIDLERTLIIKDRPMTQDQIDRYCATKFAIEKGHCFQFLIAPLDFNKTQLIFNVHHTLCDAAGQFLLLEEFFRLMGNLPIRQESKTTKTFRYRNLIGIMGIKWFSSNLWMSRKSFKKQRQYKMAGLIDHPEATGRTVSSISIRLTDVHQSHLRDVCKAKKVSNVEYLTLVAFSAFDQVMQERGDYHTPIMAYIPKTLRPFLKIRHSFQNILSTVLVVGRRDEISHPDFLNKIKKNIQSHKMDQAAKFIFTTIFPTIFITPKKLRGFFKALDTNPSSITSSMLISAGKIPRSYAFPVNWKNINVWARGTMLKSPGIGLIFTGYDKNETLTIEYVKELTDRTSIEALANYILKILESSQTSLPSQFEVFPGSLLSPELADERSKTY